MNLNHLGLFYAVAQEESVSRGAARLHISQPAVSKQIAQFERTLGTRLFERTPKGMRLTESGALLYQYAQRLFVVEADAERALRELRGLERGRLSIGASTSIGAYLLPNVLADFHQAYPGIELRLEISNTKAIQKSLEGGRLDVGFTEGFLHGDTLEALVFRQDELVFIAAPDYAPLANETTVTLARLCAEPFLLREPGSGTREVIEEALRVRGLTVKPAMTLGNTEAIKRATEAGAGVAVVSHLTVAREAADGRLAVLRPVDFALPRPLHRLQRKGQPASAAVRAFLALLRTAAPQNG